jgi:hypothetical protein
MRVAWRHDEPLLPGRESDHSAGKGDKLQDPGDIELAGFIVPKMTTRHMGFASSQSGQGLVTPFLPPHQVDAVPIQARLQKRSGRVATQQA